MCAANQLLYDVRPQPGYEILSHCHIKPTWAVYLYNAIFLEIIYIALK